MPTTLISGASRGLGLEFARQYAEEGWQVIAGCRNPDRAAELQAVARQTGKVDIQSLDVADGGSVAALARRLAGQPIDLLINNAGVGQRGGDQLGEIDYQAWLEVLSTNSLGPVRVTEALIENVAASGQKRVITISSGLGSLTLTAQGIGFGAAYQYRTSKAAVDMAMLVMAQQVKARGITVVLLSPGWVRTDMGGPNAQLSPEESIASMRRVFDGLTLEDSGRFLSYDGSEIPW
jgi:NAD(P)-dependent dehydrogenase (short-subunit alcohol dehydrogenase family)